MSSFTISGKVAIVTGGASGMGFCFANQLLENGAKGVTLVDISQENGARALQDIQSKFGDHRILFVHADTTNSQEFENAFKRTVEAFNHVDILINSAAIFDDNRWEREVDVNVKGTINGMLLGLENYIPKYRSGSEGVIVNISSVGGIIALDGVPVYAATKCAVNGLTLSWGLPVHYERTKVRVMSVCPGLTDTPMVADVTKAATSQFNADLLVAQGLTMKIQSPEHVAAHVMDLIERAPSGTLWVVEESRLPYKYELLICPTGSRDDE